MAFVFSAERLFEQSEHVYFWTMTFVSVPINDVYAMEDWAVFAQRLVHHFPFLQGLRVVELHKSHGIHFHLLLNERIPIRRMKRIARGTGRIVGRNRYLDFGRMSVDVCDRGAFEYLTKYMTKEYRKENYFAGRRRWGTIGGFDATRCRDLVYENDTTRNRRAMFGKTQIDYGTLMLVSHFSALWGHWKNWPPEYRETVWSQRGGEWLHHFVPERNERGDIERFGLNCYATVTTSEAEKAPPAGENFFVQPCVSK